MGLPGAARITCAIDRTDIGCEFRALPPEGSHHVWLTRQLGVEEQSAPILSSVFAVEQKTGLTDDPAFVSREVNADEAEVFFLRQVQGHFGPRCTAVVGLKDQAIAADEEPVLAVCKARSRGFDLVWMSTVPRTGLCGRQ